mmetsp:Transcript_9915/g.20489  ORF Transcript_9915/g.20489 Transcript_9915/m.20489 type:complete len:136 (-) Transcript_9915:79-486(-)
MAHAVARRYGGGAAVRSPSLVPIHSMSRTPKRSFTEGTTECRVITSNHASVNLIGSQTQKYTRGTKCRRENLQEASLCRRQIPHRGSRNAALTTTPTNNAAEPKKTATKLAASEPSSTNPNQRNPFHQTMRIDLL